MLLDNLCYRVNTCFTKIIPCITWLRVLYGLSLFSQGSFLVLLDYLCYRVITYFTEIIPGVTGLFLFFFTRITTLFLDYYSVSWLLSLHDYFLFYRDFSLCYFITPLFHYYSMCYPITCVTWLLVLHGGQQLIRQCLANKDHINVLLRETSIIFLKVYKDGNSF